MPTLDQASMDWAKGGSHEKPQTAMARNGASKRLGHGGNPIGGSD